MFKISKEDAQKIIHTMRSGTAPYPYAESIICGREREIAEFRYQLDLLDNGSGSFKFICGDYGIGKSLLLNAYKRIALQEDYVVASFQINNGFRLNKIEDLYYAIMHNLSIKNHPHIKASFEDIFDLWVENLHNAPSAELKRYEINAVCEALTKYNANFARAFLSYMRGRIQNNQEMTAISGAWLTGERNIPYELKAKYGFTGSVDKANTLDFLKAFVRLITLLEYKGLIVFIDELNLVLDERSDIRQVSYNTLKHLIDLTTSGETPKVMFVLSGTEELLKNKEKGILSNTPLAQRLNYQSFESLNANRGHQNIMPIKTLNAEALLDLTKTILHLYTQVHPRLVTIDAHMLYADIAGKLDKSQWATRHFVIKITEALDLLATLE